MTLSDGVEFVAQGGGGEPARPPSKSATEHAISPYWPVSRDHAPKFFYSYWKCLNRSSLDFDIAALTFCFGFVYI